MRPFSSILLAAILATGTAAAAKPRDRQPPPPAQGAFAPDRTHAGTSGPDAPFAQRAGAPKRLSDFRGRPVLVNLWASWCAPCIAELPALDRLAARAGARVTVLPIGQDLAGWRAADRVFAPGRFPALTPWLDRDNGWPLALRAAGLPVSILYDAQGREVWRVAGPVAWDTLSPQALGG